MALWFVHAFLANELLNALPSKLKSSLLQKGPSADYFFGAVAPDIRYFGSMNRDVTHAPFCKKSAFEAFRIATPFTAGYEVHLITDDVWNSTVVKKLKVNLNNPAEKFALYFLLDDYLQGKASPGLGSQFAQRVSGSKEYLFLSRLGFASNAVSTYQRLVAAYLLEPGIDTLHGLLGVGPKIDEKLLALAGDKLAGIQTIMDSFSAETLSRAAFSFSKYF